MEAFIADAKPSFSDRFARALVTGRRAALALGLVVLAAAGSGMARLGYSDDYRLFFGDDNPDLAALTALENTYARTDSVMMVVHATEGDLFTPARLTQVRDLTNLLWQMPYATRVDSLANYQHSWAEGDDLYVEDLLPADGGIDDALTRRARTVAETEPLVRGRLISDDGQTAGLAVTLHLPGDDRAAMAEVAAFAKDVAAGVKADNPDLDVALSGSVMLNAALHETASGDTQTLFPLMAAVLFAALWLFFRSPLYAFAVFAVVTASVAAAMGAMGWIGIPIMSATAVVPVIVLTVAVADAIHLLVGYRFARVDGDSPDDAAVHSLSINLMPVIITTLTTGFGFLALNFSDAPPYRDVGNMAALGAAAALFFTFTLLPVLTIRLPAPKTDGRFAGSGITAAIAGWSVRRSTTVLLLFVLVTGAAAVLIGRLHVNDKFAEYFDTDVAFREDAAFISNHLPGLYFLEFSIPAGGDGAISEPAYLDALDRFARWLEAQPEVTHVTTFPDIMKRLSRNMHGDDPAWHRLPDSRALGAQYLLLYEMSLPYGRDLNDRIDVAKSATRVTAVMDDVSSGAMQNLKARAEGWLGRNVPPEMQGVGTGIAIIFAFLTERTLTSMAEGAGLAVIMIAASLILSLRSVRLGALSVLVNLIPIILGFGLWAIIKGEIGLYAAAVGTTALGLIVDFAVHMIAKFSRLRADSGNGDIAGAMEAVGRTVGPALIVTAAVLIAGFLTLMLSDFLINAYLGLMTALVIAIALVTDLTLLPALVAVIAKSKEKPDASDH